MVPKRRAVAISGTIMAILLLCGAGLLISFNSMIAPVNASNDQGILIEVPSGASTGLIASILADAGVIHNALVFRIYARWHDLDKGFIAGSYHLNPAMSLDEIAATISGGAVFRETDWFTVPEGLTVEQIAARLDEQGLINGERFLALVKEAPSDIVNKFSFLNGIHNPSIKYSLEGYLFPDTYEIARGATEEEIIILMLRRLDRVLSEELRQRARELNLSLHEVLTLASIVERETVVDHERKLIAGVFHNRLAAGYPFESCATVNYLLDEVKPVLSIEDTKIDSPYNTYQYPGLPPGPIAAPGETSILAALYPEATDYFFFRSKEDGTGESYFARTLAEHNLNTQKAEQNIRNR
ncbi:MAG: endolytic transglycosylase MltG [Bacillota bacterium]